MKKMLKFAAVLLSALVAATAFAESAQEAAIRKTIEPRLGEGVKVDSVIKTPYGGLYEVRAGGDIFYTDAKADYLFIGRVIDAKTSVDYTRARVDEINKIKFSDLPLDSAVKVVKGNGKRVIAVFEDPNCGYCKRFRHTLSEMDNVTVYTFLYNILSPDSATKSRDIWCSADRAKAWDDWMLNGKAANAAPANCTAPNDKVLALGQKMHITGTPTIFFADGTRIPGAVDAKTLENKFASIK
ncbi:MAG TPA: DsbC family protein [Noviherbaspirillum sp.]